MNLINDSEKLWCSHSFSDLNLHEEKNLLPFRPEPLPDELLTSWLCRLARANYSCYSGFVRSIITKYDLIEGSMDVRYHSWDLDKKCPLKLLNLYSKITGISLETIRNLTLKSYFDKIPGIFIAGIKTKTMGGLRFCPLCLKNDKIPYYRKNWRLKFLTFCPEHKILMYDRCPNPKCQKPIKISIMDIKKPFNICYYCGINLSEAPEIPILSNDNYLEIIKKFQQILIEGEWINKKGKKFTSYQFFDALYHIGRLIIRCFAFDSTHYGNHSFLDNGSLENKRNYLKQRNFLYENLKASYLVLKLAYSYIKDYPLSVDKLIRKYQTIFNEITQKSNIAEILEKFRITKQYKPITKKRILNAIERLLLKKINLTYENVAKEAKCAINFNLSHPHLKKLVDSIKIKFKEKNEDYFINNRRKRNKSIHINPNSVTDAINQLKREKIVITYKNIASIIGCDYWHLKDKPEIQKIIQNHLTFKRTKKYIITTKKVIKAIQIIKEKGLKITQNEVCRQLKCHRSCFRNSPELKEIIIKAKNEEVKRLKKLLHPIEENQNLSPEAQKYEKIYLDYRINMELIGNNWKLGRNDYLSKKLNIPLKYLVEIKKKYVPFTLKKIKSKILNEFQEKKENKS